MSEDASIRKNRQSDIEVYVQVIHALVLRDMRTRFGGSHWGYAVLVLWPVAHIIIRVAIMAARSLSSPMGQDTLLFVATGAVPALIFQYISQEIMKALLANKPLIYYPQVKLFDIIFARVIVEICKGFTAAMVVMFLLACVGTDPFPYNAPMAIGGYLAAVLLGIGVGIVNVGIVSFFPGWVLGYVVVRIALYFTCGVFFLPHLMPEQVYAWMKWNPLVQILEWVRVGYYPEMNSVQVDYTYVLLCGGVTILVGLIMERTIVRSKM